MLSMKQILLWGSVALGSAYAQIAAAQTTAVMPVPAQQALENKYCAGCHNDKLKSGGFSWASVDLAHPDRNAEHVEAAIRKVRAGVMPPSGLRRPDAAAIKAFAASLEAGIDRADALHPEAGKPVL